MNNENNYDSKEINPTLVGVDWRTLLKPPQSTFLSLEDGESKLFTFKNEGEVIEKKDFKGNTINPVRFQLVDQHGTIKYWDIRHDTPSGSARLGMIDRLGKPLNNKTVRITRVGKAVDTKYTIIKEEKP